VDLAILANLPRQNLWFLANQQFGPKAFFGIGLNSAPHSVLVECPMKQYHALVPLGGVRWSANRMVRQLGRGFFGVGCPHPAIECLASQTTMMFTHYGCEMAVGHLLQPSVALWILELGMGSQPFTVDFLKCGAWVTESWVKVLWEKVFIFGIILVEGCLKICPPREQDEWIMPMLVGLGYTATELLQSNWVRVHQEMLFLSDVMDARGPVINKRYEKSAPTVRSGQDSASLSGPLQKKTFNYEDMLYCNCGMHTPLQPWVDFWKRGLKYGTGGTWRRRIDCFEYTLVEWIFIHCQKFLSMQIALTAGPGQEWISRFTFMVKFVRCWRWHWVYGKFAHAHQHYR
jgi:hypothetical protein